ncbi:MAG: PLP-dependent aminotransferase family protein [Bacteroidaceae bacterium]|nr:PLP-dependent aminotransferase family protein [Bacteroidaceae bacterium]MCF0185130.1 PLP-dependent aminotransferase family protein [Bacteroidaceae bacterium]
MLRPWSINIQLDAEDKSVPLYMQVANTLQTLIQAGTLRMGEALPSSRELAEQLGVSRKTVVTAYDQLSYTGWLINKPRVGVFVAERKEVTEKSKSTATQPLPEKKKGKIIAVDDGIPDTTNVPFVELSRAYRQLFNRAARWQMLGYTHPYGHEHFREAVAQMLNQDRNLAVTSQNICITRGSQMALYLIAHALLKPGDTILIENPGYERAYHTFQRAGLRVLPVDVDAHGINVDQVEQIMQHTHINAIYVTPRHQYPTTVTLSSQRRQQLVKLVRQHPFYVIEDDYGAEFHFYGLKLPPLYRLLPPESAVYIGSFSKILAPAIRIGMMAASEEVIKKVGDLRNLIDIQGDNIMEQAVLDLIEQGAIRRHIKRATKQYHEKKEYLNNRLRGLADRLDYHNPNGGLAIWVLFKDSDISLLSLEKKLLKHNIDAPLFTMPSGAVGMRIGYASLSSAEIDRLVNVLNLVC